MQKFITCCAFMLLVVACAATKSKPTPFSTGDVVNAPAGCVELRKRDSRADC